MSKHLQREPLWTLSMLSWWRIQSQSTCRSSRQPPRLQFVTQAANHPRRTTSSMCKNVYSNCLKYFSRSLLNHIHKRDQWEKINIKSFHSLSAETIEVVRSAMRRWNTNPKPFVRKSFLQIVSVSLDSAQQMENGILINGKAGFSEWKSSSTSCDESTSNETFSVIVTGKAHNLWPFTVDFSQGTFAFPEQSSSESFGLFLFSFPFCPDRKGRMSTQRKINEEIWLPSDNSRFSGNVVDGSVPPTSLWLQCNFL